MNKYKAPIEIYRINRPCVRIIFVFFGGTLTELNILAKQKNQKVIKNNFSSTILMFNRICDIRSNIVPLSCVKIIIA